MYTCSQCGKELNSNKSKGIHQAQCITAHKKYGHIDTEELKHLYYDKLFSLCDLSLHYNVGKGLLNYMKRLGFKIRNAQESKTYRVKTKYENTNLDKYGAIHNFCSNHPSRIKWEHDMYCDEDIINVFQRESVKLKIKETLINRYGVDHPMKCKFIADKCFESRIENGNINSFIRFSSIHKKVCEFLTSINISFETEFYIKTLNRRCFYDIIINDTLIEVNGDYWHANPNKYISTDVFSFHGIRFTSQEIWDLDEEKKSIAIQKGYKFLCLWEDDINNNFEHIKTVLINHIK